MKKKIIFFCVFLSFLFIFFIFFKSIYNKNYYTPQEFTKNYINFEGKIGAFFGCGEQSGYPHNFLDAIGILAEPFIDKGGTLIGKCDRSEYEFDNSLALKDGMLMGLGLDYDNCDDDECELLMINWLDEIMDSFK